MPHSGYDLPAPAGTGSDGLVPVLVGNGAWPGIARPAPWEQRLRFCQDVGELERRLHESAITAVLIETRDIDGAPVPAAIKGWVQQNQQVPVVVWTGGSPGALSEILELSVAGGDVRLVLRPRDDPAAALDRLFTATSPPGPGAVPALLRGVVAAAPPVIRPELTLAAYHGWPDPRVTVWAGALGLTRQALNRRLRVARCENASVILDYFSAAEIVIRLTRGARLKDIAAGMGRPDERSLRRRLFRLGTRPEQLRDEADFRALIPRIAAGIRLLA